VSLTIEPGEVVGLLGDNAAGKSTLVKIMAGNFLPSTGSMRMGGEEVRFHSPVEARDKGIEVVYQDLALCDNLSAAANVFLGRELYKSKALGVLDYSAMYRRAGELFEQLQSDTRPRDLVRRAEVLDLIRHLRDAKVAVVLVSHRLADVFAVADRLVVLRRGRKIADRKVADISPQEAEGLITGALNSV
jgi:simple sugar transport system ATP-binding protein